MQNDEQLKRQIIDIAKLFSLKGMLTSADGNFSFKADSYHIWMTPSGVNKAKIEKKDFVKLDIQSGEVVEGSRQPSSEAKMHLTVYRHCPKAQFVIHAHPPHAIAWTIARPGRRRLFGMSQSLCKFLKDGRVKSSASLALYFDIFLPHVKRKIRLKQE